MKALPGKKKDEGIRHRVTVELSGPVRRIAALRYWVKLSARDFCLGVLGTGVTVTAWVVFEVRELWVAALGGIALTIAGGTGVLFVASLFRAVREQKQTTNPNVDWTFSSDGVLMEREAGYIELPWRSVRKVWRFPEVWLIFLGEYGHFIVTRRAMTPVVENFIVQQVRSHGGRVV